MKLLWNEGWRFAKLPSGSTFGQLQEAETAPVMLPHDMLIGNEEDLYESADGWYLHDLEADRTMCGKCVLLCFDGVYMDADVLLDGRPVFTHRYGYTAFQVDLTPFLTPGSNQIAVHIRHRSPNSRWYSGAGIFRDVYLHILPPFHMVPGGVRVKTYHAEQIWHVLIRSEFVNEPAISAFEQSPVLSDLDHISVFVSLHDAHGGLLDRVPLQNSGQDQTGVFTFFADLSSPRIQPWSPEDPVLYTLRFELPDDAQLQTIGFRETAFTPDRGFFLNGVPLKLHGVCLHHDLGALGSAFHIDAARRQLLLMKQMGANAIRTSHNPPADAFLDPSKDEAELILSTAGAPAAHFKVENPNSFISVSEAEGTVKPYALKVLKVRLDRKKYKKTKCVPEICIHCSDGNVVVKFPVNTLADIGAGRKPDGVYYWCGRKIDMNEKVIDAPLHKRSWPGSIDCMDYISIEAKNFYSKTDSSKGGFKVIEDYSRGFDAVKAYPQDVIFGRSGKDSPKLTYKVNVPVKGNYTITFCVNPSNPYSRENEIFFGVSANGGKMKKINMIHPYFAVGDGNPYWSSGVLQNKREIDVTVTLNEGVNDIDVFALDPNFVLQKLVIFKAEEYPARSYLGPEETFRYSGS